MKENHVWVFRGRTGHHPGAVFTTEEKGFEWINKHQLEGILTAYPLDISAYDWAIQNGHFTPTKPEHQEAYFIASFTTAAQDHYHFEHEEE